MLHTGRHKFCRETPGDSDFSYSGASPQPSSPQHSTHPASPIRELERGMLIVLVFVITACSPVLTRNSNNLVDQNTLKTQWPMPDVSCDSSLKTLQETLVHLTNLSRSQGRACGTTYYSATTPIKHHSALQIAAERHSADMAKHDFFSHISSNEGTLSSRVKSSGYVYQRVAENIAAGHHALADVHAGWLASPSHCHAIMEPTFTDVGIACQSSEDSRYVRYWTAVYGKNLQADLL